MFLSTVEEAELQGLYAKAVLTSEEVARKEALEARVPMAEEVVEDVVDDYDPMQMSSLDIWMAGWWI